MRDCSVLGGCELQRALYLLGSIWWGKDVLLLCIVSHSQEKKVPLSRCAKKVIPGGSAAGHPFGGGLVLSAKHGGHSTVAAFMWGRCFCALPVNHESKLKCLTGT